MDQEIKECSECEQRLEEKFLETHLCIEHLKWKPYKCNGCSELFATENMAFDHMERCHLWSITENNGYCVISYNHDKEKESQLKELIEKSLYPSLWAVKNALDSINLSSSDSEDDDREVNISATLSIAEEYRQKSVYSFENLVDRPGVEELIAISNSGEPSAINGQSKEISPEQNVCEPINSKDDLNVETEQSLVDGECAPNVVVDRSPSPELSVDVEPEIAAEENAPFVSVPQEKVNSQNIEIEQSLVDGAPVFDRSTASDPSVGVEAVNEEIVPEENVVYVPQEKVNSENIEIEQSLVDVDVTPVVVDRSPSPNHSVGVEAVNEEIVPDENSPQETVNSQNIETEQSLVDVDVTPVVVDRSPSPNHSVGVEAVNKEIATEENIVYVPQEKVNSENIEIEQSLVDGAPVFDRSTASDPSVGVEAVNEEIVPEENVVYVPQEKVNSENIEIEQSLVDVDVTPVVVDRSPSPNHSVGVEAVNEEIVPDENSPQETVNSQNIETEQSLVDVDVTPVVVDRSPSPNHSVGVEAVNEEIVPEENAPQETVNSQDIETEQSLVDVDRFPSPNPSVDAEPVNEENSQFVSVPQESINSGDSLNIEAEQSPVGSECVPNVVVDRSSSPDPVDDVPVSEETVPEQNEQSKKVPEPQETVDLDVSLTEQSLLDVERALNVNVDRSPSPEVSSGAQPASKENDSLVPVPQEAANSVQPLVDVVVDRSPTPDLSIAAYETVDQTTQRNDSGFGLDTSVDSGNGDFNLSLPSDPNICSSPDTDIEFNYSPTRRPFRNMTPFAPPSHLHSTPICAPEPEFLQRISPLFAKNTVLAVARLIPVVSPEKKNQNSSSQAPSAKRPVGRPPKRKRSQLSDESSVSMVEKRSVSSQTEENFPESVENPPKRRCLENGISVLQEQSENGISNTSAEIRDSLPMAEGNENVDENDQNHFQITVDSIAAQNSVDLLSTVKTPRPRGRPRKVPNATEQNDINKVVQNKPSTNTKTTKPTNDSIEQENMIASTSQLNFTVSVDLTQFAQSPPNKEQSTSPLTLPPKKRRLAQKVPWQTAPTPERESVSPSSTTTEQSMSLSVLSEVSTIGSGEKRQCLICHKSVDSNNFSTHVWRNHVPSEVYKCSKCPKHACFGMRKRMEIHVGKCPGAELIDFKKELQPVYESWFRNCFPPHDKTPQKVKFLCQVCHIGVTHVPSHVWAVHMSVKRFRCSQCGYQVCYSNAQRIKEHVKSCTGANIIDRQQTEKVKYDSFLNSCFPYIRPRSVKKSVQFENELDI